MAKSTIHGSQHRVMRGDGVIADAVSGSAVTAGILELDGTAGDIAALGVQAAGSIGLAADAGHVHPTTGMMVNVAATPAAGYNLVNSTGNVITWTAPNDGALHRFQLTALQHVTVNETGGAIQLAFTAPDGTSVSGVAVFAGGSTTGVTAATFDRLCQANTAVTVTQSSALTVGAAVAWAQIWGA